MTATFFWITLYLQKYYEVGHKIHIKSVFCTEYIFKIVFTIAMVMFFMLLAMSRVYLGEHSFNEVLFGSTIGITFAIVMHF